MTLSHQESACFAINRSALERFNLFSSISGIVDFSNGAVYNDVDAPRRLPAG